MYTLAHIQTERHDRERSAQRFIAAGTTGRVRLPGGILVSFEITELGAYRWGWRVARVPATGNGCRVGSELPLYGAVYAPICQRALARIEGISSEG
jgi:hypothetical protein